VKYHITFQADLQGQGIRDATRQIQLLQQQLRGLNANARQTSTSVRSMGPAAQHATANMRAYRAAIQQTQQQLARLQQTQQRTNIAMQNMGGGGGAGPTTMLRGWNNLGAGILNAAGAITKFYIAYRLLQLPTELIQGFTTLSEQALRFTSFLRTSQLGIGSLLASFADIRDAQGRALDPQTAEGWAAALDRARGIQDQLKRAAIETSAEYSHLLRALQEGVGPAIQAGFDDKQIVEFTKMMTQAAAAIQLPFDQLGQEVRAIFEGDMSRFSRITRLIFQDLQRQGIVVKDQIAIWREQGVLYDEIAKRLQFFARAGEEAMNTYETALSNLRDAVFQALGEAFGQAHDDAASAIRTLTSHIVTFNEQGEAVYNPNVLEFFRSLAAVVSSLSSALTTAMPLIETFTGTLGGFLDRINQPFDLTPVGVLLNAIAAWDDAGDAMAQGQATRAMRNDPFGHRGIIETSQRVAGRGAAFEGMTGYFGVGNMTETPFGVVQGPLVPPPTEEQLKAREKAAKKAEAAAEKAIKAAETARVRLQAISESFDKNELRSGLQSFAAQMDALAVSTARLPDALAQLEVDELEAFGKAAYDQALALEDLEKKRADILKQADNGADPGDVARALAVYYQTRRQLEEDYQQDVISLQQEWGDRRGELEFQQVMEAYEKITAERNARYREDSERQIEEMQRMNAVELFDARGVAVQAAENFERDFGNITAQSFGDGLKAYVESGEFSDFLDTFSGGILDAVGGTFTEMMKGWLSQLSNLAQGLNAQGQQEEGYAMGTGTQRGARFAQNALVAGAGAYGIWTNGGTRRQNVMNGAITGVSAGATIGATYGSAGGIYGMIIGAIIGAALGAFAPSQKGKNIRINGSANGLVISGIDDWGAEKILKDINASIANTTDSIYAILFELPTSVLEAVGKVRRPDLTSIILHGKADGENWSDELQYFITETVPAIILEAYMPVFEAAATVGGVTKEGLERLAKLVEGMDTQQATKLLNDYFTALFGILDVRDLMAMAPDARVAEMRRRANQTPLEQIADIDTRIATLSQGIEGMTFEEQIRLAGRLNGLIQERYQLEMEWINRIEESRESSLESIDRQIFGYEQATRDPQEQMDALLLRNRTLEQRIANARTPEELERALQEFQQNIDTMIQLAGGRPEDYAQGIATLKDLRERVDARYDQLVQAAIDQDAKIFDRIQIILATLQEGFEDVFDPFIPGGGGGGGGDHTPPTLDPMFEVLNESAELATTAMTTFTGGMDGLVEAIAGWTATIGGGDGATVTVEVASPVVSVNLSGDAAGIIDKITTNASASAEAKVLNRLSRRDSARLLL
jgi:hypothetical protein